MKLLVFIYCSLIMASIATETKAQKLNLLIGTYTKSGKSEGIYVYEFDTKTGKSNYKNKAVGLTNPSYLALSNDQKFVYAVNEAGPGKGAVSAFSFDKETGALSLLNQKPSAGDGPCYVAVNKSNNHVFVANYVGGSFSVLPVQKDGSLGDALQTEKFVHNGVGKGQQGKPHAHSTVLSPDEKYVFVSDLGNDEILEYSYSAKNNTPLKREDVIKVPAGNGPRHFEFHPNQQFAYSIQELTCDILAYSYKKGKLSLIQTIEGKPAGFNDKKSAADIHISPDGKFLYSSNRDEINDIAIFSIQKDGGLTFVGRQSVLGKTPRNFVIDPTGNYLLAANQNSDNIVIFKRDKETGLLNDTGERIEVGSPVCLKFGKIE